MAALEVKKETASDEGGGGGIKFTKPPGEVKPPFSGREEDEQFREPLPDRGEVGGEERVARAGKVPLHPAVIRLPFSILGRVGTELTQYPGFTFTEQELNDLAELWVQCGIEASPILQASIGTTAMTGGKFLGYFAWVKAGKPSIPGAAAIGQETAEKEEELWLINIVWSKDLLTL